MRLLEGDLAVEDVDEILAVIDDVAEEYDVTVQTFDARYVVDRDHLRRAVELADRAFDRGENVARERAVEILCYAAARRQINRAMTLGIEEGEPPVVVLVDDTAWPGDSESTDAVPDRDPPTDAGAAETAAVDALRDRLPVDERPTLGEYDADRVREWFDVGDAELAAADDDLAGVVRERVALLDVEK